MKVSRIFPYYKTSGERRHDAEVNHAKLNNFKHPGSKTNRLLHMIHKTNVQAGRGLNFIHLLNNGRLF